MLPAPMFPFLQNNVFRPFVQIGAGACRLRPWCAHIFRTLISLGARRAIAWFTLPHFRRGVTQSYCNREFETQLDGPDIPESKPSNVEELF